MKMVDADLLRKKISNGEIIDYDCVQNLVNELLCAVVLPLIDNMPKKEEQHGYWEALYAHEEPTSNVYRCSNCGKGFADYLDDDYDYYNEYPVFFEYDRCPHCGAIMDGDTVFPSYRPDGKYSEYCRSQQSFIVDDEVVEE